MRTLGVVILFLLILTIAGGVFSYVQAKSGSSIKWTPYSDPYGRFSITYPSKWKIDTEPVHSTTSPLLEVPLKISSDRGSALMVEEAPNSVGLSVREFTSLVKNSGSTGLPEKIINPISCGFSDRQPAVAFCSYSILTTVGLTSIGSRVDVYSFSSDKFFVVTFMTSEYLGQKNINYMLDSFKILQQYR